MKSIVFLFPLLLLSCTGSSQFMQYDYGYEKKIQIRLTDEKIIGHESGFNLKVSITNKTDTAFLVYSLKDVEDGWWNGRSTYMKPNTGMGSVIFILDQNRKQINFELDNDPFEKYEKQFVPGLRDSIENRAFKSKMIIPAKGTIECIVPIIPKKNRHGEPRDKLPKGEFSLSFLLHCGYNITSVLPKERILEDEKKYNAMMYQGYVESNTVKLIVK